MRNVHDLYFRRRGREHALELTHIPVRRPEIGEQCHERTARGHTVNYTFRVFHRPARHRAIIPIPRPAAVAAMTVQIPLVPHRFDAQPARGMRDALMEVDVSIGATVYPAPPSAPSSTSSLAVASLSDRGNAEIVDRLADHRRVSREDARHLPWEEQLDRYGEDRRRARVGQRQPPRTRRSSDLTSTEVLPDDRRGRGAKPVSDHVEPAFDPESKPHSRKGRRPELRDRASNRDEDRAEDTPVTAVGSPTRVIASIEDAGRRKRAMSLRAKMTTREYWRRLE